MKTPLIGILAGMGPRSTAPFIDLVITECQRQYGAKNDIDFPPILIYSLPAPFFADRPVDHVAMESTLHDGLRVLERAGADFMAIACNTAHIYHPQLALDAKVPLLNMVDLTVQALPAATRTVAVIGARPTVESGIYQTGIVKRGFDCVEPDWQTSVDTLIESIRGSVDPADLAARWSYLATEAKAAGADVIVLGCADLSAVGTPPNSIVVDATQCLAQEIVTQWVSRSRT